MYNNKNINKSSIKTKPYNIIIKKYNIFKFINENFKIYTISLSIQIIKNIKNKIKLKKKKKKLINIEKKNYINFLNNYNNSFVNKADTLLSNSCYGQIQQLEIIGYIRRAWYKRKKLMIIFRLGFSYYNYIFIPKIIKLKLIKKRILFFFSNDNFFLRNKVNFIKKLKPSDSYKISGIILNKEKIKLKKNKKQRSGSSY